MLKKIKTNKRINVEEIIRQVLKRTKDKQNKFTGWEICASMINSFSNFSLEEPTLIFNIEFAAVMQEIYEVEKLNNVWLITCCPFKAKAAIYKFGIPENQILLFSYNNNTPIIILNSNMPKFKQILINPAYGNIFPSAIELAFKLLKDDGEMGVLSPASYLAWLSKTGTNYRKFQELKRLIGPYITYVNIQYAVTFGFSEENKNGIGVYGPLAHTHINKKHKKEKGIDFKFLHEKNKTVNSIDDVNLIGDYSMISSIEEKLRPFLNYTLADAMKESINSFDRGIHKNFYLNLRTMVGNGKVTIKGYDGKYRTFGNLFNILNNKTNKVTKERLRAKPQQGKEIGNWMPIVSFDDEICAENARKYITKTLLVKYLCIAYNFDQHIDKVFNYIPWLNFKEELTDDKIKKILKFTNEQYKFMLNIIDRKSEYGYGYYD